MGFCVGIKDNIEWAQLFPVALHKKRWGRGDFRIAKLSLGLREFGYFSRYHANLPRGGFPNKKSGKKS